VQGRGGGGGPEPTHPGPCPPGAGSPCRPTQTRRMTSTRRIPEEGRGGTMSLQPRAQNTAAADQPRERRGRPRSTTRIAECEAGPAATAGARERSEPGGATAREARMREEQAGPRRRAQPRRARGFPKPGEGGARGACGPKPQAA